MDKDKKNSLIIGSIIALIIIFFLLWKREKLTVVRKFDDSSIQIPGSNSFGLNLADLKIPNLSRYLGVTNCRCGDAKKVVAVDSNQSKSLMGSMSSNRAVPISYTTPAPVFSIGRRRGALTVN